MKEKVSYETGWTQTLAYSVYINSWQWGLVWFTGTSSLRLDEVETRGSTHDDADLSGHVRLSWCQLPAQICGFTITVCFPVWFPPVAEPVISLLKKKNHLHIKHRYTVYINRGSHVNNYFVHGIVFFLYIYIYKWEFSSWFCWMFYKKINIFLFHIWQNHMQLSEIIIGNITFICNKK